MFCIWGIVVMGVSILDSVVFVILFVFWLLRYVLTIVVCMSFMFILSCLLFMVLGFVSMSLV